MAGAFATSHLVQDFWLQEIQYSNYSVCVDTRNMNLKEPTPLETLWHCVLCLLAVT